MRSPTKLNEKSVLVLQVCSENRATRVNETARQALTSPKAVIDNAMPFKLLASTTLKEIGKHHEA
jgi:hypothetical protein